MEGFVGSVTIVARSWRTCLRLNSGDAGSMNEQVSCVTLKSLALEMLDRHSMLRMLVLAEQDSLPSEHAIAKVQVFARIFYEELTKR